MFLFYHLPLFLLALKFGFKVGSFCNMPNKTLTLNLLLLMGCVSSEPQTTTMCMQTVVVVVVDIIVPYFEPWASARPPAGTAAPAGCCWCRPGPVLQVVR